MQRSRSERNSTIWSSFIESLLAWHSRTGVATCESDSEAEPACNPCRWAVESSSLLRFPVMIKPGREFDHARRIRTLLDGKTVSDQQRLESSGRQAKLGIGTNPGRPSSASSLTENVVHHDVGLRVFEKAGQVALGIAANRNETTGALERPGIVPECRDETPSGFDDRGDLFDQSFHVRVVIEMRQCISHAQHQFRRAGKVIDERPQVASNGANVPTRPESHQLIEQDTAGIDGHDLETAFGQCNRVHSEARAEID